MVQIHGWISIEALGHKGSFKEMGQRQPKGRIQKVESVQSQKFTNDVPLSKKTPKGRHFPLVYISSWVTFEPNPQEKRRKAKRTWEPCAPNKQKPTKSKTAKEEQERQIPPKKQRHNKHGHKEEENNLLRLHGIQVALMGFQQMRHLRHRVAAALATGRGALRARGFPSRGRKRGRRDLKVGDRRLGPITCLGPLVKKWSPKREIRKNIERSTRLGQARKWCKSFWPNPFGFYL